MSAFIFFVGFVIMIFGFAVLGFLGSPNYKEMKRQPLYFARTFCIGLFLVITGAFALISPFYIVYPYYPFNKDVISIEDNDVVYHRWGTWRKPNVMSICADGTLRSQKILDVGAMKGKLYGKVSFITEINVVDIPAYFKAFPERNGLCASIVSDYELYSRIETRHWDFAKEYINREMPEGKEYQELLKTHFNPLRLQGIEVSVKVYFDPTFRLNESRASS